MIEVREGIDGLRIQRNQFRDADIAGNSILVFENVQNLRIVENTFEINGNCPNGVIRVGINGTSSNMSANIVGNIIGIPAGGVGIHFQAPTGGNYLMNVAANDFLSGTTAIKIGTLGAAVTNIDLGGGILGSPGGNNFRFFRTPATGASPAAIFCDFGSGTVPARNNMFGQIAEAAVYDHGDDPSRINIDAGPLGADGLTGNAAYVQALFVRFLRRTGDVNNPADAGGFVNLLNSGVPATTVVNAISRSMEAIGYEVDELYRSILNRDADPVGRATWVTRIFNGATLESVKAGFFASPEYTSRYSGDRAYVVSLYATILHRTASGAEYDSWIAQLPILGRAGVANAFLNSAEAHGQSAARLYLNILKRPASAADITFWANAGLDELSIRTSIAASPEGKAII